MHGQAIRTVLTVAINVLIVCAIALCVRQAIVFSAQIASQPWAQAFNALTKHLVIPFGLQKIKTPYGGVFDVNNAVTIVALLLAEWGLTVVRDRA